MTFIEAIIAISKRDDIELCADEDELSGVRPSICVYKKNGDFVGKLRWPKTSNKYRVRPEGEPASVDEEVIEELTRLQLFCEDLGKALAEQKESE